MVVLLCILVTLVPDLTLYGTAEMATPSFPTDSYSLQHPFPSYAGGPNGSTGGYCCGGLNNSDWLKRRYHGVLGSWDQRGVWLSPKDR